MKSKNVATLYYKKDRTTYRLKWERVTSELGTKGHHIASFYKNQMFGLTIYMGASNIPIFNLIPKEANIKYFEKKKKQYKIL